VSPRSAYASPSFFTRVHARLYRPSLIQFSASAPPQNSRLALQFQKLENAIHTYVQEAIWLPET